MSRVCLKALTGSWWLSRPKYSWREGSQLETTHIFTFWLCTFGCRDKKAPWINKVLSKNGNPKTWSRSYSFYHLLRNCDHLSVVTLSEIFTSQSTIKSWILARTTVWSKPRVNAFQAQFLFGEIQHFIILFILRKWLQSTKKKMSKFNFRFDIWQDICAKFFVKNIKVFIPERLFCWIKNLKVLF